LKKVRERKRKKKAKNGRHKIQIPYDINIKIIMNFN